MIDWKSWKTWAGLALAVGIALAIYTFAAPDDQPVVPAAAATTTTAEEETAAPAATKGRPATRKRDIDVAGIEAVRLDWLEPQGGAYSIKRNIFAFYEAPVVPPVAPKQPVPVAPPDKDKDGILDFRDNCVGKANPDQQDIDRDGIGTACESEAEIAPPLPIPPEPPPPTFPYKYIGTFGTQANPIATFSGEGELINARIGDVIANKFILRSIGIESVEIGFTGFPPQKTQRIPLGQ
jgi:hypothetical protein